MPLSHNPDRRRAIDDLFDGALDLPPDEREEWLQAQHADPAILAEVSALLRAHDRSAGILEQNALDAAGAVLNDPPPMNRQIGAYRLLRELGRGGMGVVYLAERADGQYRRRVAVKVLRSSPDAEELHRRFVAERQILASLNHPNIAQLLDGGVTDGQLPYLVMEYVDGVPITTYCDRHRLSVEERLRLFHDVCAAVHHAHQNLIIHRDLKPGNILVTQEGRVKLLDFGIAKLLNPTLGPDDQPLTRTEFRVMTPEYASPEQVCHETLTTASDVYTLGVVLYQLLCGQRPYRLTNSSPQELSEVICRREPELPSVSCCRPAPPARPNEATGGTPPEAVAAARGLSADALRRRLRGDLDAIIMMALRKEPSRRYGSVDLLWEDVQRHLDGLPLVANHGTRWYRARKMLGRHRGQATAAALVILSLVVGATVAVRQAAVAGRERDRAEQARMEAEQALARSRQVSDFLVRLFDFEATDGTRRDEVTARELLVAGESRIEALVDEPLLQGQMLDALGRVHEVLGQFNEAERMLRRALELRRSRLGENHADVASTLEHLATVLRQMNRSDEASGLFRRALAILQQLRGPSHPEVAVAMRNLAISLANDRTAAESLLRAAREIQRTVLGPEHLEVTSTNFYLVDLLEQRGDHAGAEALLRENLAARTRQLGPEHPSTALSMIHLANRLSGRAAPAEVESLYVSALAILRKHPDQQLAALAAAMSSLGDFYASRGDLARAVALAREALETNRRLWGDEHPFISEGMGKLAHLLFEQGENAEAERLLSDAVALVERSLGPTHSRVALLLNARGRVRTAMRRYSEAEADLRRALTLAEGRWGPDDQWAAVSAALLADVMVRVGRTAEAEALFARSSTIFRRVPPRAQADMRAAYLTLANHYRTRKQSGDETYFRQLAQRR